MCCGPESIFHVVYLELDFSKIMSRVGGSFFCVVSFECFCFFLVRFFAPRSSSCFSGSEEDQLQHDHVNVVNDQDHPFK